MKSINVKKFLELSRNGKLTDQLCPKCQSKIFLGESKEKWCVNDMCTWSNDRVISAFLESQLKIKKDG